MSDTFLTASEASKIASTNKVVLREINLIQEKILDAVHNCSSDNNCQSGSYCITVTGDTPMTYFGQISTATVTNGGQDYEPVVATASFTGSGTGATADLTINSDGEITDVEVTAAGTGYTSGGSPGGVIDSITVTNSGTGGYVDGQTIATISDPTGTGAVLSVNVSTGDVVSIDIVDGGSGYTDPVVTITDTGSGDGLGATAEATFTTGTPGTPDAEIVVSHPSGVDFDATVQVDVSDGSVTGVTIVNSGSGYGPLLPEITLANTGNGQGAVLTPDVEAGVITGVTVEDAGYLYDTGTTATVTAAPTSAGADATVTLTVTENPLSGVDPYNYYLYLTDQDTACPVEKDIQHIISYFRKKDYSIQAQINPTTNSTIQWKICWCQVDNRIAFC